MRVQKSPFPKKLAGLSRGQPDVSLRSKAHAKEERIKDLLTLHFDESSQYAELSKLAMCCILVKTVSHIPWPIR